MGNRLPGLTPDVASQLRFQSGGVLERPVTFGEEHSNYAKVARQFFSKIFEVRHVSWNRGGCFFHELFEFYKRWPKLQPEFLAQTIMQIAENPSNQYAFQLHWVLMEFLFHGENHILASEALCT